MGWTEKYVGRRMPTSIRRFGASAFGRKDSGEGEDQADPGGVFATLAKERVTPCERAACTVGWDSSASVTSMSTSSSEATFMR